MMHEIVMGYNLIGNEMYNLGFGWFFPYVVMTNDHLEIFPPLT